MKRLFTIFWVAVACAGCDPARDSEGPKFILGPEVIARDTSISIAFVTDEEANALVEYGPDTNYGTAILDERYIVDHSVLVTPVTPQTEYHLRVITQDALDNGRASIDFTVTTTAFSPPPLVVVNEVLANAGNESTGEFVELFNADVDPVDLAGYTIGDSAESDELVPFTALGGTTTTLAAGAFAVILDPEYGQGGEDYTLPPAAILLTVEDSAIGDGFGLSNSTDTITLRSSDQKVVSTYGSPENTADAIPRDPGNGISIERCIATDPDEPANWANATDAAGHTAGSATTSTGCP